MLHHPHLVQVYGICSKDTPMLMITEWLANGDLVNYLRRLDDEGRHKELPFLSMIRMAENVGRILLINFCLFLLKNLQKSRECS